MREVKFYASSQPLPYDHSALCCCTSSSIKTTLHHQQNLHNDSLSLSELFVLLQHHPQATTINTLQKARFSHIVMPAGMMLDPFPCNQAYINWLCCWSMLQQWCQSTTIETIINSPSTLWLHSWQVLHLPIGINCITIAALYLIAALILTHLTKPHSIASRMMAGQSLAIQCNIQTLNFTICTNAGPYLNSMVDQLAQ